MGGFLVALDQGLYRRVEVALVGLGGVAAVDYLGGVVQVADEPGRLFTLYERVPEGTESEYTDGPFTVADGVLAPDMERVTACPFECQWPDMVARLAETVAGTAETPTWLLDGDGVLWNAEGVDVSKVRL